MVIDLTVMSLVVALGLSPVQAQPKPKPHAPGHGPATSRPASSRAASPASLEALVSSVRRKLDLAGSKQLEYPVLYRKDGKVAGYWPGEFSELQHLSRNYQRMGPAYVHLAIEGYSTLLASLVQTELASHPRTALIYYLYADALLTSNDVAGATTALKTANRILSTPSIWSGAGRGTARR